MDITSIPVPSETDGFMCCRCHQWFDVRDGIVTPNGMLCGGCAEDEEYEL